MHNSQEPDANGYDRTSAFPQTQQLLGAYPFVSATPSTHVARHLSNLSLTATPPSYIQPAYYSTAAAYGHPEAYQHEVSCISTMSVPNSGHERAYWDAARSDVFRMMPDHSSSNCYSEPFYERPTLSAHSAYQLAPFAQSIIQHEAPYNAYPTPPPASISFSSSSSSLANALGSPTPKRIDSIPKHSVGLKTQAPDPAHFFDAFLNEKLKELPKERHSDMMTSPPSSSTLEVKSSSPFLQRNGTPSEGSLSSDEPRSSPKKRKLVEVVIETPSKQSSANKTRSGTFPVLDSSLREQAGGPTTPSHVPRMRVFVEITPLGRSANPLRHGTVAGSSPDLGGYGTEEGNEHLARKEGVAGARWSGRRTGERDDRAPLEKFLNLAEDIFEADDNVSPDGEVGSIPGNFFSELGTDPTKPLLHPDIIVKLTKAISKVARPTKRLRLASGQWDSVTPGSPRKAGGMADVEVQTLSRLLKLLERSVQAGEDLDPFRLAPSTGTGWSGLPDPEKPATQHEGSGTHAESGTKETAVHMTVEDSDQLERILEMARESVLAANCCLALLTSDRLAKQLFSEDLILSSLTVIKNSLTKIIYPFVEAPLTDAREFSVLLRPVLNRVSDGSPHFDLTNHRRLIGDIFRAMSSVFPRINSLICSDGLSMPESIIIPAVYIAIGPFFVIEATPTGEAKAKRDTTSAIITDALGSSGMRGLRLEALSLVRSIYAYHEDQRPWIIEEILTSLVRLSDSKQKAGMFRLRDGRSIRTVSALLLQLVQTSAHSVRVEADRLMKTRRQQLALRRHESTSGIQQEFPVDQLAIEEAGLYSAGLDAPTKAAKSIVVFLTQRSGRGKSTKNTNELEYRVILDNLINDLLIVLFRPEWPAASIVLSIVCKYMISSLDDVKSSSNDNNVSKTLALDHLGVIASRLRSNTLKWCKPNNGAGAAEVTSLRSLDDLTAAHDKEGLIRLISAHQEVSAHLSRRCAEDHAFESARELDAVMWGQELASTLLQLDGLLGECKADGVDVTSTSKYAAFASKINSALQDIWKDAPTDVFDNTTQEEMDRADGLAEQLGTTQALKNAFDPILNVIVLALDAPAVFVRTKALRALSHILAVDSSVLTKPNVRHAIESHLLDSSPQVRDAAVELIGKYIVDSPVVAVDYYHKIAERIADTGLGVRKRVIKLLKAFYGVTTSLDRKIDTCSKLVLRMLDEDDGVKDLSVKTLEELWFSSGTSAAASARGTTLSTVSVIMGVCNIFKDRQSPLEDMLRRIVHGKESEDAVSSLVQSRFKEIYDVMIEGLVDATDYVNFMTVNCIRAIYLFTSAFPSVLTGSKASVLLPYLKSSTSNDDVVASDYILKIYRVSIPHMSKTSIKFGTDLQTVLQPMVLRPNVHGPSLQEVVACLCAVVQHLTHDSVRIVALLRSCIARLRQFVTKTSNSLSANDARTLHILVVIVSLLGEHFNFDKLRSESAELSTQLDAVSKGPIIAYIYTSLLQLYERYPDCSIRGRLLVCLGFLFRAQPTLMTLDSSATIMDAIFASPEDDNRARLLKIMQDFLASESAKYSDQQTVPNKLNHAKSNTGINMEELVGNTHGFAESGVSSAVVQRYLNQILDAALSPLSQAQASAVDILSFTVKQGLAHPLLSFPVVVALETSPVGSLSMRAVALHTILHHKHASLLNSGFIAACRRSFDYQCKLSSVDKDWTLVRGYRMLSGPVALLGRWYALVREKRATRQEFLRSILKVFELRDAGRTDGDTVQFSRYMAENFASFDYRTQEEVLTVLKTLTRELAETGAQLVEQIAPGNLLAQLRTQDRHSGDTAQTDHSQLLERPELTSLPMDEQLSLARSTCVVGTIMLLKSYLKSTYGLSEEKCQKFVIGKKSAIGDRPAVRRKDDGISWERMPFAVKTIRTAEDVQAQRASFLEIWNEDGAAAEPDGDEWE